MFSICLTVCQQDNSESSELISMRFYGGERQDPWKSSFHFRADLDERADPGLVLHSLTWRDWASEVSTL